MELKFQNGQFIYNQNLNVFTSRKWQNAVYFLCLFVILYCPSNPTARSSLSKICNHTSNKFQFIWIEKEKNKLNSQLKTLKILN